MTFVTGCNFKKQKNSFKKHKIRNGKIPVVCVFSRKEHPQNIQMSCGKISSAMVFLSAMTGFILRKPLFVVLENNNVGSFGNAPVKVDNILIEQADTAA